MYFSIAFVLFALLLLFVIAVSKRKSSLKKVCALSLPEKCEIMESLLTPLGYSYNRSQDIISSRNDAWQREFGYRALFDQAAPHLNMVFDCLPVYFDYQNRTWLLELWKGQYGINTGAEIGLYYADRLLAPYEREVSHFHAVTDASLLPMGMTLVKEETTLAVLSKRTWWLTAFSMGRFSRPEELSVNAVLLFPDCEMLRSFLKELSQTALSSACVQVHGRQVQIRFGGRMERNYSFSQRLSRNFSLFASRFFCRLYLLITRPFCLTIDRLLYLYYLLPFCFRRTLRLRRCKKKWHC